MAGISKPRMLVILSAAIRREATDRNVMPALYYEALRDVKAILECGYPRNAGYWGDIIAESDKRSHSGFAAMSRERLREVSAHGRGNFTVNKLGATEAGKKGASARMANTTPEQRREWSARGAKVTNSKRRR